MPAILKRPVDAEGVAVSKRPKGKPQMDKSGLETLCSEVFPQRHHLGTIIYNPTTTWESLQVEQLHGLQEHDKQRLLQIKADYADRAAERFSDEREAYIPVIPPLTTAYINSFLEVKIPYKFIKKFINGMSAFQNRRELWGGVGGLYSDDSDLLSVLSHLGLFEDKLDLTDFNPDWKPSDVVRPLKAQVDEDGVVLLDLSVTLLMMPTLEKYHGFYRNGINSRSWLSDSIHDGLSYGVYAVKWETYLNSMSERSLSKLAQREFVLDKDAEEQLLKEKNGWLFDYKYYKQLKDKIAKETR